ncbi:carbonic anhydrase 1-like isoform X2 [Choristoneura fumiferana]|uniref:carbonic anhydrase 1-like isoform X2 n=1 Tax=Choristoneura fumiferana TaxID=7141 RepID=UPI003D15D6DB
MVPRAGFHAICITCLFVLCILNVQRYGSCSQDQTSQRVNTLRDDADDIQRQLDNEARDRIKYGRAKTIWVLHFPTRLPIRSTLTRKYISSRLKRTDPKPELNAESQPELNAEPQLELNAEPQIELNAEPIPELTAEPKPEPAPEPKPEPKKCPKPCPKPTPKPCPKTEPKQEKSKHICFNPELSIPPSKRQAKWKEKFPKCGGCHQSPMKLPVSNLAPLKTDAMTFCNFHVTPKRMMLNVDSHRISLSGEWPPNRRPTLFGGVLTTRRYSFEHMVFHWPSEHIVGEKRYPLETQAYFVASEYRDIVDAIAATTDKQAILGIASLYNFANFSQPALEPIIEEALYMGTSNESVQPEPLVNFIPMFKDYATYQGSLPTPPCSEVVLWLVPARTLPVTKRAVQIAQSHVCVNGLPTCMLRRSPQKMNNRTVFYCKSEIQISQSLYKDQN